MGNNKKILVVDDSETNVLLLQKLLEEEGYESDYAYSGEAALKLLKNKSFSLILLDIMMPGLDGFDILQTLKEQDRIRNTPIIMVTAKDDYQSQKKAIEMGATDYLTKPLDLSKLKELIHKFS
jgi:DNA-binding response OmpR family regulator